MNNDHNLQHNDNNPTEVNFGELFESHLMTTSQVDHRVSTTQLPQRQNPTGSNFNIFHRHQSQPQDPQNTRLGWRNRETARLPDSRYDIDLLPSRFIPVQHVHGHQNRQNNNSAGTEKNFKDITSLNTDHIDFDDINLNSVLLNPLTASLNAEDVRKLVKLEHTIRAKVQLFVKVIDERRKKILQELEIDSVKMNKERFTDSPQAMNFFTKLQRIRIRAIETETLELHRLKTKLSQLIEDYKKAMQDYCSKAGSGVKIENPTDRFQKWIEALQPNEIAELQEGLNELAQYSTRFLAPGGPHAVTSFATNKSNVFPVNKLPSEILHLVLDKLSRKTSIVHLLVVCKSWAQIIIKIIYYRPHINKKTQLDLFMRTMRLSSNETIFNYRLMIKRLNFSFVGDYLTDEELYSFVGCKNLERLTLVFCKHVTSKPVSAVLQDCQYLQSVDITGIKDVEDNIFHTLASNCIRIQGFYVPQAKNVSFEALIKFISHASMLKRVKITANNNINDEIIELLADRCPMLVEVDITLSPNVHDQSLVKMFTKLGQLREFRITHNFHVSDKLFFELAQKVRHFPSLRLIDFSGCEHITDKTIEYVVDLAPKLRNVFLGKCSRITDTSLIHLSRLGKNLQTVHFGHCFNITDAGVRVLVKSCPRIQYVDFACCTNLTNHTLYELSYLTKLKRIGLVKCSQMTDDGLLNMIALRGRNDTLERVHLSYCSNITIYPIYELLMACPRLSHLSLTAIPSFLRPDITAFCRPTPPDFSDNQRQIFCVFSGKGVHKLRHYLMGLTTPTDGPQIDVSATLGKYIINRNLLNEGETIEQGIIRITRDLNQDSAAILAATGFNQINGTNGEFPFPAIDFERLDDIFSWYKKELDSSLLPHDEINELLKQVNKGFCEEPFDEEFNNYDPIVAPGGTNDLNEELRHIVKRFHQLDDRVCDFEVNVASLARVQFQFTGFLLHEMTHTYMLMVDLNRQITSIQNNVLQERRSANVKAYMVWRLLFVDKFAEVLQNYKLSTVVLRLYLKDSITLLTRQRELILAHQRSIWSLPEGTTPDDSNIWRQIGEGSQWSEDQLQALQSGLRLPIMLGNAGNQISIPLENDNVVDARLDSPDEDIMLEES